MKEESRTNMPSSKYIKGYKEKLYSPHPTKPDHIVYPLADTKECSKCGGTMYQEDVLIGKTTQANIDEVWGMAWVCEECDETEEFEL